MTRLLAAFAFALATIWPMNAGARTLRRSFCVPVYIEGAGAVQICAPARAR